jgi:acyl carrier protein
MAIARDEIFTKVQEVLVDALGVDEDEVTESSTLMGDLGAESIDFLDVVFRLEKAFSIKIPREELFPAESLMSNQEYVQNGKLTAKGIAELKSKMPHAELGDFEKDPDINKLGNLFTVRSIVAFIDRKVNA